MSVVGSLRRYIHGLPVLGRASVHVGLGGNHELTKWGVDWRAKGDAPISEATVIDPNEGAARILAELQRRRPEQQVTLDHLEPERMSLGYVSMPRLQEQRTLQPAWVAMFRPRGQTTMGAVIAVPAAPAAFEPLSFPGRISR
jgi:hypothetical protein